MEKPKKRLTRRERLAAERGASTAGRSQAVGPSPAPAPTAIARLGRLPWRGALLLAALVVVPYLPALGGGFVWDDVIVVETQVVHDWSGLWNIWFSPGDIEKEAHYWPVVYTSFWLEHKLWGLAPLGYHGMNVLLHLANVLLIWRLLARLAVPGAWVVAAVFAVHPLHVESVAWIIERKDVLSALFYLTAALAWIRYTEAPRPGRYLLALGLFTAGLLSKSIVVTLPAALLIWHWWQAGRITRTDLTRLAPLFAVALAVTAADLAFYTAREPLALDYSLVERVLIAARALWFYAGKLLWPVDLAVIYPLWEISAADPVAWAYVLGAVALAGLLWRGRQRFGRGPLAGALFFAVTLSPVLGFIDYGYMQFSLVADRFQYLAGLGMLAVLLGAAAHGARRLEANWQRVAAGGLAVVLVLFGAQTWLQARIYRDGVTLFSHIIAHNPDARHAHLNLTGPLADAGRLDEALAAARIGLERSPEDAGAHANLGRVLVLLERYDEAEVALQASMQLDPQFPDPHQNLAEAHRRRGRHEAAVEAYRWALAIDDGLAVGYAGLGASLFELARYDEALPMLERALALDLDAEVEGGFALLAGRAARELGRLEAASAHLQRAAALEPDSTEPLVALSGVLRDQGRAGDADDYLRRVRVLAASDAPALHNAAEAVRKGGRPEESLAWYRDALQVDPELAPALVGRGAALVDLGRHEEAHESLERAIALEMDAATSATAHYLAGRALYELGRTAEAAAEFERSLEHDPDQTQALDYLASLRFGQQEYEDALALYEAHAALEPEDAIVQANIGVTLYFLDRREEARASMERVLQIDPQNETALNMIEDLDAAAAQVAR